MSQETTYAGIVGDWQRLLAPVRANGEELAHLEALRAKLETLAARVRPRLFLIRAGSSIDLQPGRSTAGLPSL